MSPITEAMKPSRNSDRQSCASSGELLPKNGTAFATESPTTFVSSRPTSFGSSRRAGIAGNLDAETSSHPTATTTTHSSANRLFRVSVRANDFQHGLSPRDSVCRFDPGGLGKNNLGRRQERVWRAHRLGAKVYAVTTSAGGRDRAPTLESRKSPANCGLFVTGQHVEYSNARLVRNVRAARQHILHTRRH